MNKAIIALLVLSIDFSGVCAQTAIPASGGNGIGDGGTTAYSVGQVAYTNFKSGSGEVSLGVQQIYLNVMVATEVPESNITVSLFPNPVQNELQLSLSSKQASTNLQECVYKLYDLSGMELLHGQAESTLTSISIDDIAEGVYFLEVTHKEKAIKTFKVIKTN